VRQYVELMHPKFLSNNAEIWSRAKDTNSLINYYVSLLFKSTRKSLTERRFMSYEFTANTQSYGCGLGYLRFVEDVIVDDNTNTTTFVAKRMVGRRGNSVRGNLFFIYNNQNCGRTYGLQLVDKVVGIGDATRRTPFDCAAAERFSNMSYSVKLLKCNGTERVQIAVLLSNSKICPHHTTPTTSGRPPVCTFCVLREGVACTETVSNDLRLRGLNLYAEGGGDFPCLVTHDCAQCLRALFRWTTT